jgi:hypothetical protein
MGMGEKLKDILDWGKRIQFVFQVVGLLFSASVVTAARAMISYYTHIPTLWRAPIYFLSAGIALLLFASLGQWWSRRLVKDAPPTDTTKVLEEVMGQGANAALYDYMWCRAIDLIRDLDALWHHWDNAGEKLIYPLNSTLDKLKDPLSDVSLKLIHERRDFMVLYAHHLMIMKLTFSDIVSKTIKGGFPSDREYFEVRSDLEKHAEELKWMAKKTWEKYGGGLDY